jgi:hypothetical protein
MEITEVGIETTDAVATDGTWLPRRESATQLSTAASDSVYLHLRSPIARSAPNQHTSPCRAVCGGGFATWNGNVAALHRL